MLKVTTRYICSQFIPSFLAAFIFFVAFLNTFYMFRMLSLIVDKGVEVKTVLMMVFNLSVSFFPLAAPLAVFFATIYVLNKLSEDSEIIAMRSFGMSKFQLYVPFLISSIFIGAAIYDLSGVLIPKANADFKNTVVKLTSSGMLTSIKSGQFFTDIPKATLYAQSVSEDGNGFENVFLHLTENGSNDQKAIFARTGTLIKIFADEWHAPSLRLHLMNGNIITHNKAGERVEKILFEEYDFPILNADFASQMLDKDSMKTNEELLRSIALKKELYLKDKSIDLKKNFYKSLNEYLSRMIIFWQVFLFIFVGFTLGIKKGRGKGRNNTITAGVILIGYFSLYFLLLSFSQKGNIDPYIANYLPLLVLFLVGLKFYKDLDWAT